MSYDPLVSSSSSLMASKAFSCTVREFLRLDFELKRRRKKDRGPVTSLPPWPTESLECCCCCCSAWCCAWSCCSSLVLLMILDARYCRLERLSLCCGKDDKQSTEMVSVCFHRQKSIYSGINARMKPTKPCYTSVFNCKSEISATETQQQAVYSIIQSNNLSSKEIPFIFGVLHIVTTVFSDMQN